jgi:glycosyltransferase involved in cell wall biosynthesis
MLNEIKTKFFTIAIPTYEMYGKGVIFLEHQFKILEQQTFNDFDIVISDHSSNDDIKVLCEKWSSKLDIKYFKNTKGVGKSSSNINYALNKSTGEWIKIIFQDDFLYGKSSLENLHKHIKNNMGIKWVITACEHTKDGVNMIRPFYPKWNNKMHLGVNTYSSPSVLCIKNETKLFFNEELVWLMDVDYYKRMYDKYGEPYYLNDISVVNRLWGERVSNILSNDIKNKEKQLMINYYGG